MADLPPLPAKVPPTVSLLGGTFAVEAAEFPPPPPLAAAVFSEDEDVVVVEDDKTGLELEAAEKRLVATVDGGVGVGVADNSRPVNEGFHRLTANWWAADTVNTLQFWKF